ncbi:FGGY-family carbohydrate kinase [Conexibacter arvalis]|uniref:Glycerol kinase n=1 Tax=Conexibacter arvalis TaxID=912552 RepID=A0A840IDT7_9ACTN|nr:FGGY family carbohydrate kinase [Conexibacter arvalis]MBB4662110.1 glycerol kinase [Conexibacter arvalis]
MPERGPLVLAIDQGSSNTKAILVERSGEVVASASSPVPDRFPQPGWVEQDADAIWASVLDVIAQLPAELLAPARLAGIGITNQRESIAVWEARTGAPAGPVVSWQCRRGAELCRELVAEGAEGWLRERTGLTVSPLFSASKASWLLDAIPDGRERAAAGELCLGTVDAWLIWKLTGGRTFATDASNASRTQLLNLRLADWDEQALARFGIPRAALPRVRPSSGRLGETLGVAGLADGIPVAAAIGDSHGALFGHRGFEPGTVKTTMGTGTSVLATVRELSPAPDGLMTTIAWQLADAPPTYGHEGIVLSTGSAVDWVRTLLGLDDAPERVAELAREADPGDATTLVPAFGGLTAPYWDADAQPVIHGVSRRTGPRELARAAVDSTAFQVNDVLTALARGGAPLHTCYVDGGASANVELMQLLADISGLVIRRPPAAHLSALGAAYLAGLAVGVWDSLDELAALDRTVLDIPPRLDADGRAEQLARWAHAVSLSRSQPLPVPAPSLITTPGVQ